MSFIRLKKRVSKSKENYYAYLVSNTWGDYSPKQKVKAYIGRYLKLSPVKNISINLNKKTIFTDLLKKELFSHGFIQKKPGLFFHPEGFSVNLKSKRVLNKDKNLVCIGINQGYLCNYTLNNLLTFKYKNNLNADKKLIRILLDIGITPNKELFSEVFNKLA